MPFIIYRLLPICLWELKEHHKNRIQVKYRWRVASDCSYNASSCTAYENYQQAIHHGSQLVTTVTMVHVKMHKINKLHRC